MARSFRGRPDGVCPSVARRVGGAPSLIRPRGRCVLLSMVVQCAFSDGRVHPAMRVPRLGGHRPTHFKAFGWAPLLHATLLDDALPGH